MDITIVVASFLLYSCFPLEKSVARLGDDKFQAREEASFMLELGIWARPLAYFDLKKLKKKQEDPEVVRRINTILEATEKFLVSKYRPNYKLSLRGYGAWPQIDESLPDDYSLDGKWAGWPKWKFVGYYKPRGNSVRPYYLLHRKATQLFMAERVEDAIQQSLRESKDEGEFKKKMKERMGAIQKELDIFIQRDRNFYKKNGIKNPFEVFVIL